MKSGFHVQITAQGATQSSSRIHLPPGSSIPKHLMLPDLMWLRIKNLRFTNGSLYFQVNGTLVTHYNHIEVVNLIKCKFDIALCSHSDIENLTPDCQTVVHTVQPKNNARARSAARTSCTVRARNPPQEVKMLCFCGLPARTFETQEVESLTARSWKSNRNKPQEPINLTASHKKGQEVTL